MGVCVHMPAARTSDLGDGGGSGVNGEIGGTAADGWPGGGRRGPVGATRVSHSDDYLLVLSSSCISCQRHRRAA
eukprot:3101360-Prymnesium_polylepis.2